MKDHEKRELVSELVGIASIAHGTEQLRDRIAYALSGVFSAIDGVTGRADKAESELAKLAKQESVASQFLDGGKWYPFISDDHMKNTIAAGKWEIRQLYAAPVPAVAAKQSQIDSLAVLEEWCDKLLAEFPLLDDEGLCQEKHHCEWTLQQDRKRLHTILQSTPTGEQK